MKINCKKLKKNVINQTVIEDHVAGFRVYYIWFELDCI